tara:strand:+ start:105 stop:335 length:231 start_codon:yes stop_codon:yes gene_type:complete
MLCLALLAASSLVTPPGVVRVKDAVSRRPVLLVGTMHYNPHSVAIVQGAVQARAITVCSYRTVTAHYSSFSSFSVR